MEIEDSALMFKGWSDGLLYEQKLLRKVTALISDITNRSFGGKGVEKAVRKAWPLPGDSESSKLVDQLKLLKQFKDNELKTGVKRRVKNNGK